MADGSIYIDAKLDKSGLKPQLNDMKKSFSSTFASMRDIMMGPVSAAKMVIGAVQQVGKALDGMIMNAANAQKTQAILSSTLKATGAGAWTSRDALNQYADSMSRLTLFEDDAISGMQGILLGFKNIKGDNFEKASTEILNMSQVMGMDLTSAAQAVGKALDNPAQGMDSLSRQGFKFTQQEKEMMRAMQDSGNIMGAQKIILDELSSTYGGAAAAAADTATGVYQNFKKAIGEVNEQIGILLANSSKEMFKNGTDSVNNFKNGIANSAVEIDAWVQTLQGFVGSFKGMFESIDAKDLESIMKSLREAIEQISRGLKVVADGNGKTLALLVKYIAFTLDWIVTALGGFMDFYTGVFTGDWNKAWEGLQKILLVVARNMLVTFESMANAAIMFINGIITTYNKVAEKLKLPTIKLKIDPINLGLLDEVEKRLGKLTGDDKKIVGKKYALDTQDAPILETGDNGITATTEAEKKKIREAYEKDWLSKLTDLQNDTLEEQRDAEIAYAESIGAETSSIREYYFIKIAERNEAIEKEAAEKAVEAQREAAEESRRIWDETISGITGGIDAIAEGANEIGGDAASGMVDLFSFIADLISAAAKDFMDVGQDIQLVFSLILLAGANMPALFEDVTSGVVELATMLMSALGPIFEAVMQTVLAFMPIFKPIVALVAELAKLVAPFIPMIAMIEQLWVNLSGIQVLLPIIVSAVQLLANAFLWFYNDIIRPVYNFLILVFNKIYNAFANFFNSLLAAVDAIPLVELSYRMALKAETEGQLERISTAAGPAAGGVTEFTADLDDANERLRKNRTLFTKATEAAAAYQAVLTRVVDSVADFYDGLKDVGSDIAGMIVDSLTSGFDNDDFLFALEEYITKSILQAAVFTDAFMAQVADIGAKLARAIATGDTGQIEALKNQLSELYSAAAATAQTVTGAVSQAFGSYAVGTLALPQDGLIYAHAGEAVIPSGLMAEAMARGLTIAPTNALISGAQQITINLKNALTVDGREIASAAFRYQDELVGAAYGG
jgi:hypothetical protein